jgi:NADH-quinone oxidoreductase subunit C
MGIENSSESGRGLSASLKLLTESFPEEIGDAAMVGGDASAVAVPEALFKILDFLKKDPRMQFDMLVDLTAVDYLGREPRFEVVYHLLSLPLNQRIRIKTGISGAKPVVDSVVALWASANWLEREVWDMFGIEFAGHPDLKRILLYPEFEGHPLRKDYPIRRRQPLIGPKN